jgi:polynucleotide 5'-kinase involved in rRNA processing
MPLELAATSSPGIYSDEHSAVDFRQPSSKMTASNAIREWLTWSFSPAASAIFVTLFISLTIPLLIHWYLYRQAVAKELPTILLVGPSGAGKTTLLTQACAIAP